jgi:glycosyltransferase involved in cell wall biosynthesis
VGVAPEVIRNGENGFIVSTREEAQARVAELLADTQKRLQMAEAARATAGAFKSERIADELLALYKDVREKYPRQ